MLQNWYLHRTSIVEILDKVACPIPFSATQQYRPAADRKLLVNVKFPPLTTAVRFSEVVYHVTFG